MRTFILAIAISAAGCHHWNLLPGKTLPPVEPTPAAYAPYDPCLAPGLNPGAPYPLMVDPSTGMGAWDPCLVDPYYNGGYILMEPGAAYVAPGVPQPTMAAPQAAPATEQPGWFDVLPSGSAAISPDFGLPAAPVVGDRLPNPMVVRVVNEELAWDQLADVVSTYFRISREQPVQLIDGVLTEGFIQTPPQAGATILEPQRKDSVGAFNRWQSTLQSIRRRAYIRVTPTAQGWAIEPQVFKELEDLPRPEESSAGLASVRNDTSLPSGRRVDVDPSRDSDYWIPLGRDEPLEQKMLREIYERLTGAPIQ